MIHGEMYLTLLARLAVRELNAKYLPGSRRQRGIGLRERIRQHHLGRYR
jgi:hypothetical protein